jgi:hypothetical protein
MPTTVPEVAGNRDRSLPVAALNEQLFLRSRDREGAVPGPGRLLQSRRSFLAAGAILSSFPLFAADPETPVSRLAVFAAALNNGDAATAQACFDKSAPGFDEYANYVEAICAQTEVECTIEPITESGEDPQRIIETDWLMQLKARVSDTSVERRRERVTIHMRQIETGRSHREWRIFVLTPVSILFPIKIQ